ncbi:MAG: hypothetical protein ACYCW7_00355 [Pseudomonadaceae bacterium]
MAAAAVAGTVIAYNNGQEQKKAAEKASQQALAASNKQAAQADQAFNRANQKRPDSGAILSATQQAGKAGASGTMLTGPQGVDPSALNLGKSTLLGM